MDPLPFPSLRRSSSILSVSGKKYGKKSHRESCQEIGSTKDRGPSSVEKIRRETRNFTAKQGMSTVHGNAALKRDNDEQ